MDKKFKYQEHIDMLAAKDVRLPLLYEPDNMAASRFVFSEPEHESHIPQYVSNPRRMLRDITHDKSNISLLALSCFATPKQACRFYASLAKAFKNVATAIGNSLAEGLLRNDDGRRTAIADNGHFDFYEYEGCDLSQTFRITKTLQP